MRILNKISIAGSLFAAVFFLASCGSSSDDAPVAVTPANSFSANLTVAQEVPAPSFNPIGSGSVTLDPVTRVLTGSFTTIGLNNATLAHIHNGVLGVAGPVVVPLTQSAANTWSVPANTVLTDAQIALLQAGSYYVNIHTTQNAAGEIRGQLTVSGTDPNVFNASLTVAQEVPAPTITAPPVPSGSGSVTLDPVTKVLTGSFTTVNIASATAAHIHDGNIGVAGPVIVPLAQTAPGSGIWIVPASALPLTDAQIARLRAGGYYVNVHTPLNPGGEIRGQLAAS